MVLVSGISDSYFWGLDGRIGVITRGEWVNRLILVYPDALGTWTFVADSAPPEEMFDFYPRSDQAAEEVIAELGIVWLTRSPEEEQLEKLAFGLREHLGEDTSVRGMLRDGISRFFGRKR